MIKRYKIRECYSHVFTYAVRHVTTTSLNTVTQSLSGATLVAPRTATTAVLPQIPLTSCLSTQYRNLQQWTHILKIQNSELLVKAAGQTDTQNVQFH